MSSYFKNISAPVAIEEKAMLDVVNGLVCADYTLSACAARLGVDKMGGIPFLGGVSTIRDSVTVLLDLFIRQRAVLLSELEVFFSTAQLDALQKMNLIAIRQTIVTSDFCLFPCYDKKYIATDHKVKNTAINQIMYLFTESYILGGIIDRRQVNRTLDLCTGSGIHAILAAHHSREVIGVDINPRAVAFSNFNAKFNGADNVTFLLGDLYQPADGKFDLILANPPYNPDVLTNAGDNFWSGGISGTEILSRIIEGLPFYLSPEGICMIISLFPINPGTTIKQYVDNWLGNDCECFDAFESTVPTDNANANSLFKMPDGIKTENFKFGILGLKNVQRKNNRKWEIQEISAVFDDAGMPMHVVKFDD